MIYKPELTGIQYMNLVNAYREGLWKKRRCVFTKSVYYVYKDLIITQSKTKNRLSSPHFKVPRGKDLYKDTIGNKRMNLNWTYDPHKRIEDALGKEGL